MSVARPCPFCGKPAKVVKDERLYFVGCVECDMMTCEGELEIAVEKWNRRATDALLARAEEALTTAIDRGSLWGSGRTLVDTIIAAIRKHREEVGG